MIRCSRCHSLNTRRSRRRIWERPVTLLLPILPHRCRACQARFWRRSGALFSLPRILSLSAAALVMAFFAIHTLGLLQPELEPPDASSTPRTARARAAAPVPKTGGGPRDEAKPATQYNSPAQLAASDPGLPDLGNQEVPESKAQAAQVRNLEPAEPEAADWKPQKTVSPDRTPTEGVLQDGELRDSMPSQMDSQPAAPAGNEAADARSLTLIEVRSQERAGVLELEILAGAPIRDFLSFTLEDPRRIVIDLPGSWRVLMPAQVGLNHYLASRLRVGRHTDRVRLVIDAALDTDREPRIEPSEEGLMVRLDPVSLRPLPGGLGEVR